MRDGMSEVRRAEFERWLRKKLERVDPAKINAFIIGVSDRVDAEIIHYNTTIN